MDEAAVLYLGHDDEYVPLSLYVATGGEYIEL